MVPYFLGEHYKSPLGHDLSVLDGLILGPDEQDTRGAEAVDLDTVRELLGDAAAVSEEAAEASHEPVAESQEVPSK